MMQEQDAVIKINATHSHTKLVLAEQRFHQSTPLGAVKEVLSQKFGTSPEYMKLKLIKPTGEEFPFSQYDEEKKLKDLNVQDLDTIHVIDFNPSSFLVQNNIDDLSGVQKYKGFTGTLLRRRSEENQGWRQMPSRRRNKKRRSEVCWKSQWLRLRILHWSQFG